MLSKIIFNIIKTPIYKNTRMLFCIQKNIRSNLLMYNNNVTQHNVYNVHVAKRFKSKKKTIHNKNYMDEDFDSDEDNIKDNIPVGSKMITINTQSLRLDAICKSGFGISRNKIEVAFYDSKIRLNEKKVLKKSIELDVGDEIDMILQRSMDNPKFLVINRIVILSVSLTSDDNIRINLSRDKNLLIEDYQEPWASD